jgi:MoaA/NifB/PqqE/SkfB family radical SAM enzyme
MGMIDRLRYAPLLVQLVVTRRCNLTCGYCNEYDGHSAPVPTDTLKARIDRIKALGALSLEFTGGEPMLHPEIYELIRHARQVGFPVVLMISNAYLFNEERIRRLNEAGLDRLQISIDGVEPNDVTVKVLAPLRRKLEIVARCAEFEVTLSGVVGSSSESEVREVVDFARTQGFIARVLLLHDDDGQLDIGASERDTYRRLRREIGGRFDEAGDYRMRLMRDGVAPFRCRAGSRYLYVDEAGIVRWCSQQLEAFGRPLEEYTVDDLREQFHTPKACSPRCTVGCARTASHFDRWRPQRAVSRAPGEVRVPRSSTIYDFITGDIGRSLMRATRRLRLARRRD